MTRFMLIAPVAVVGLLLMMIVLMAPPSYLSATNGAGAEGAPISVEGIPPDYLALYWKADQEYDIDWAILAAIGSIDYDGYVGLEYRSPGMEEETLAEAISLL